MDLKAAYEIMGIPENSSKEELEKRFDILVRRMRIEKNETGTDHSETIIKAYNIIKESERQRQIDQYNVARFGTNVKKKQRFEKREQFWIKNRWKVITAIAGIAVIAIISNIVINNIKLANLPKPDLSIMMYGDYYGGDEKALEQAILVKNPDWVRVKTIINYLPGESTGQMDPAFVQKSFVILATERPDIYILDKTTFETMQAQNALVSLDAWKDELNANYTADQLRTGRLAEETDSHIFGIDISDDPMWKELNLPLGEKIAVLSVNQKNLDNAKRFIIGQAAK